MKETIKEIIENSFIECIGTNEAIDDASFFIEALINRKNKRQRLIESIENRLFELTKTEISTFELIDIIVFLFEYKRCKNIHEIINKRQFNSEVFYNIYWYLKNENDNYDPNDPLNHISPPCKGGDYPLPF